MIVVIRCFNRMPPLVVETFEGHDEQTQKDANELAAILSRKNNVSIKYSLIFLVLLLYTIQRSRL